jgi:hypothetical protein
MAASCFSAIIVQHSAAGRAPFSDNEEAYLEDLRRMVIAAWNAVSFQVSQKRIAGGKIVIGRGLFGSDSRSQAE